MSTTIYPAGSPLVGLFKIHHNFRSYQCNSPVLLNPIDQYRRIAGVLLPSTSSRT